MKGKSKFFRKFKERAKFVFLEEKYLTPTGVHSNLFGLR